MIQFPTKPEKTTLEATFPIVLDKEYTVRLTKKMNGVIEYTCECLTECEPAIKKLVEDYVVNEANKNGAFEPTK